MFSVHVTLTEYSKYRCEFVIYTCVNKMFHYSNLSLRGYVHIQACYNTRPRWVTTRLSVIFSLTNIVLCREYEEILEPFGFFPI